MSRICQEKSEKNCDNIGVKTTKKELDMEEKFTEFLLTLNRINAKLKELSGELDKLNADFIEEDFEKIFSPEQLSILDKIDYD